MRGASAPNWSRPGVRGAAIYAIEAAPITTYRQAATEGTLRLGPAPILRAAQRETGDLSADELSDRSRAFPPHILDLLHPVPGTHRLDLHPRAHLLAVDDPP